MADRSPDGTPDGLNDYFGYLLMDAMQKPEMRDALAQMGVYGDRQGLAQQQAKIGASLFGTPTAEGRTVGHTYVASSPLEHLGVALERGIGARKMNEAQQQQQGLIQSDVIARQRYSRAMADAMRRARGAQQPAAQPTGPGQLPVQGGGVVTPLDPYST